MGGALIVQPCGPKASAKTLQNLGGCFGDFQQPQAFAQGAHQLGLGRVERAAAQGVGQGNQAAQAGRLFHPVFGQGQLLLHLVHGGVVVRRNGAIVQAGVAQGRVNLLVTQDHLHARHRRA